MNFDILLDRVKQIHGSQDKKNKLMMICDLLKEEVIHYDWVGIYVTEDKVLSLGPFAGEPTEHMRIEFGKGVCGSAAEKKKTVIVGDVSKEKNYLSCDPNVKSEIVVPIMRNGKIIGELDIDSHTLDAFTESDKKFLEEVAVIVSMLL